MCGARATDKLPRTRFQPRLLTDRAVRLVVAGTGAISLAPVTKALIGAEPPLRVGVFAAFLLCADRRHTVVARARRVLAVVVRFGVLGTDDKQISLWP